jgi:DNA-binding response OmpR family regulator
MVATLSNVREKDSLITSETPAINAVVMSRTAVAAKILVVDDEPDIVMALAMRLKSVGYVVITAGDGAEATKKAIHEKPDLILLDIGMPCGDGHTIANRLAGSVDTVGIPIIYLTARTSATDRMKAMSLGAYDYITKPFTSERLLGSIERALCGISSYYEQF